MAQDKDGELLLRKEFREKIGLHNVVRCCKGSFWLAMIMGISAAVVGIFFGGKDLMSCLAPCGIMAGICLVFAVLFKVLLNNYTIEYYDMVTFIFLVFLIVYGSFVALTMQETLGTLALYYCVVVLGAYLVFMHVRVYIFVMVVEALCFGAVVMLAYDMGRPVTYLQYIYVGAAHIFSFFLSKGNYSMRDELTKQELLKWREVQASERDPLTGLINRRGLERATRDVFKICKEEGRLVGMMILDIDHFKKYNDGFGHVKGDACLQKVAKCLADTVGDRGTVSRIGGEEFLIFVHKLDAQGIFTVAEDVRAGVEAMKLPHATGKGDVVTISVGVYLTELNENSVFTALYNKADKYLYKAKTGGRNRVECNRKIRLPKA